MAERPDDLSEGLTAAPSPGARPAPPGPSPSISGSTVGHFEVMDLLGAGGFGEVYRARDARLGRMVALKVLPAAFALDAERRERFRLEAMAASALNHPNICTVYELIEAVDKNVIVMELVEGKTLHAALAKGPLPAAETLSIALQIADALAEAHRAGVLHRDIKSSNIMLTRRDQVKVLDFGLAKLLGPSRETRDPTLDRLTAEGTTLGTLSYMSPEQLLGKAVDRRSDLFSFGVVLYEMVTGWLPFEGSTPVAVSDAILHAPPRDFGAAELSEILKAVIRRLLEKEPARRYASAAEVRSDLKTLENSLATTRLTGLSRNAWIALAAMVVLVAGGAGWIWHRWSRERWALGTATPEVARLVSAEEYTKAAALLREARTVLPNDPTIERLWRRATTEVSVESVPAGADVSFRPYRGDPNAWESLGQTPVSKAHVASDIFVWRILKSGFVPAFQIAPGYFVTHPPVEMTFRLQPVGSVPADMVFVSGDDVALGFLGLKNAPRVRLDEYLIDRHEVTNEEYRKFVDAGGYQRREFWKQTFVRDGRTVPWEDAASLFRDATGRPGPATWEVGSFPTGLEKHPVAGVSWYEAAAYAEFAGKILPTIYHWSRAAQTDEAMLIVPGSNFRKAGTQPVESEGTLSGFGTSDMAGNVKEWCWNESRGGRRYILGGGFGEPSYMFDEADAQSPWDRRPNFGFRCAKYFAPPPPAADARREPAFRDYTKEKPVTDEVFKAFKGLYSYDKGALNAKVEETEATQEWTRERVSFDAAYGRERVMAHLYLPKNSSPPYQLVVYFPGSGALWLDKLDTSDFWGNDFVPKSGRALVFPIYKSTFERRDDLRSDRPQTTAYWRDHMIAWSKDLGRSLDYVGTRKDIDPTKMAYIGYSWGADDAPIFLTVENRIKAAILVGGGFQFDQTLPEVDVINFITRLKIPVLMLNGRYDSFTPMDSSQVPYFRFLGTPEKDKRHIIYDSGHVPPRKEFIRETLDWLDKYLGPVKR
jgi:formylglycine-generating enzyme required for sulfatase activity/dienelactone hydrolase/predicted Ser/Thr protein kinase